MSRKLSEQEIQDLLAAATAAGVRSYSPHSRFRVGAAVLTESGDIFVGTNIENDSFGLSLCAERSALASWKVASDSQIIGLAVVCLDAPEASKLALRAPCGACRQWILQLANRAEIVIGGDARTFTINQLLPSGFNLQEE